MSYRTAWESNTSTIYNVVSYGADPTGATSSQTAFAAALAACKASARGGIIRVPTGSYALTATLDLSDSTSGSIELVGDSPYSVLLTFSSMGSTSGVKFGKDMHHVRIANLLLVNGDGSLPASQTDQHGIMGRALGGTAICADGVIESVFVQGWGDHGISLIGGSGPIAIRDCVISFCAGYGLELDTDGVTGAPQDTAMYGGTIREITGGLLLTEAYRFSAYSIDIELTDHAAPDIIHMGSGANGCMIANCTISTAHATSGQALVYCAGPSNTFVGNLTYAHPGVASSIHYYFDGSAAVHNTVTGGYATKDSGSASGYFGVINGATHTTFIGVGCSGFHAGYDTVYVSGGSSNVSNNTTVINVGQGDDAYPTINAPSLRLGVQTYGYLPSGAPVGTIGCISDATTSTWGAVTGGGGGVTALVMWNGADWKVFALGG